MALTHLTHTSICDVDAFPNRKQGADWKPVDLPGDNFIAGPTLFPGQVIAGYNAPDNAYTAETWTKYVLDKAQSFDAARSCCSFSCTTYYEVQPQESFMTAINSGSTGGRFWFGYGFRAPATADDFQHANETHSARAFSVSE
ncbi:hypothetical protein VKT23_015360 [Stygiomarasmius scandens]|uniref:Uncharacterized protein n=1 Tax=Marasmiellus scandens TaxID=2682957 RepID=A0ABR1J2M4_9AGAR